MLLASDYDIVEIVHDGAKLIEAARRDLPSSSPAVRTVPEGGHCVSASARVLQRSGRSSVDTEHMH